MIYFTIVIIVSLVALLMLTRKPAKTTTTLTRKLTRKEQAIGRATDRMGW